MHEYKFLMMPKYNQIRLLQETFKVKQTKIASRLNQDQEYKDQEEISLRRKVHIIYLLFVKIIYFMI